jgi:hypothetical protein
VQGYGATGEGAAAANLETIRSVNGLTVNRNLQASLTLGLLNFLGIDPGLRSQVTARFSDLSIVRVKDVAQLAGPSGEPRIYEALKAGSVTISTDRNFSLNLNTAGISRAIPLTGRATSGLTRSYSLDARDMFIAIRVVTPMVVRTRQRTIEIGRAATVSTGVDKYQVDIDARPLKACIDAALTAEAVDTCKRDADVTIRTTRPLSGDADRLSTQLVTYRMGGSPVAIPLLVPLSDDRGGLLTEITIDLALRLHEQPTRTGVGRFRLSSDSQVTIGLKGTRMAPCNDPDGIGW